MLLDEIKEKIDNKTFVSGNFSYKFTSGNTLTVNNNFSNSFRYALEEEEGRIYLIHNNAFGTEDLEIDVLTSSPFEFRLLSKFSGKIFDTWRERT